MSRRGSGSNQIGESNHKTAIICVVLLSVLAVCVVFGMTAGMDVTESAVQSGPPAGDFAPVEDTADACVPAKGESVLWHLERYGAGCPERTGGSPVGERTGGSPVGERTGGIDPSP
ncbi:hypothetical protein [Haladaptatus cibarius]|uniref:hypothetical protein n=1 Tax=Haladaptatus cibarius TaxID=453847 RepID=UPI00118668BD|nr:hypothetical protein [Haladaptatus cibarius]